MTTTTTTAEDVWAPYETQPVLTPQMALGPRHVDPEDMDRLRTYLAAVVASRRAPVHVNVAFNAAFFGYDPTHGGYVGGPLGTLDFPELTHEATGASFPVGAFVNLTRGEDPVPVEVVYRDRVNPAVHDDGDVPEWVPGAPAGASDPATGGGIPVGPVTVRERLVVDFDAFGSGLAGNPSQLCRWRRQGKWVDSRGHVHVGASYPSSEQADLDDAEQYQRFLLDRGRHLLLSETAPLPLRSTTTDEDGLPAALAGIFATVAEALVGLDAVRLWGQYATRRADLARRLDDDGALGRGDLDALAGQLANAGAGRGGGRRVRYTAIGRALALFDGGEEQLVGLGYATTLVHANLVAADYARGEADPVTGILDDGSDLAWTTRGATAASGAASTRESCPTAPTSATPSVWRWRAATGQDPLPEPVEEQPEATGPTETDEPAKTGVDGDDDPDEDLGVGVDVDAVGKLRASLDSEVLWTQTLRAAHLDEGRLPLPVELSWLWEGTLIPGVVRLELQHDGEDDLEDDERSQGPTLDQDGDRWQLTGISWPLEFFAGIRLSGTWFRGIARRPRDDPARCPRDRRRRPVRARLRRRRADRHGFGKSARREPVTWPGRGSWPPSGGLGTPARTGRPRSSSPASPPPSSAAPRGEGDEERVAAAVDELVTDWEADPEGTPARSGSRPGRPRRGRPGPGPPLHPPPGSGPTAHARARDPRRRAPPGRARGVPPARRRRRGPPHPAPARRERQRGRPQGVRDPRPAGPRAPHPRPAPRVHLHPLSPALKAADVTRDSTPVR